MLRRLRILLVLFLLMLWIDRSNRRDQLAKEWKVRMGEQDEGDSIVLEKDAPIILVEEAPLARVEDTPAAVAGAAALEMAPPAAPEETGGMTRADIPSGAGVFAEGVAPEMAAPEAAPERTGDLEEAGETERDDLTVIEGVGSRIAEVLQNAGIHTFEQLAQSEPDRVKEILRQEGLNIVDPATWMEQAELAAKDEWETLEELQGRLNAGRRE